MKKPLVVEHKITVEQLRTAGIVAGITISRSAFPNRLYNTVTYSRYNGMWDKKNYPSKGSINDSTSEKLKEKCFAMLLGLLKHMEIDGKKQFAVGKTRTYFRSGALEYLESHRQKGLDTQALTVQRVVRGWLIRKKNDDLLKKKKVDVLKKKQAEQARREKLAKESKEREIKREKVVKTYKKQIDQIEKEIEDIDKEKVESISSLRKQIGTKIQEQKDYEKKLKGLDKDVEKGREIIEENKDKIEENKTFMSKLKQDHKRLSKVFEKVEKKHKRLSVNNGMLEGSTKKESSMFSETFPGASNVFGKYDNLKDEEEIVIKKHKKLNVEVSEWQDEYWKKASARLEVQKSLGKILSLIQDKCKNQKLIEKTQIIGLKCEKQSNKVMKKVDAEFESSNTKVVCASSYK
jgi:myosin heavy subunit